MKKLIWMAVVVCLATACVKRTVVERNTTVVKKDNGKHKGWYKNPNNPHNPAHGSNTTVVVVEKHNEHENGQGNGHGKGKKDKK
jgi:hypothetical protein